MHTRRPISSTAAGAAGHRPGGARAGSPPPRPPETLPGQDQRSGENNHRGDEHGVTVHHGAGHDEDQPCAAARYPQHGYAAQPGIDIRRPELTRQLDQAPLPGDLGLQLPQPAPLIVRHRHDRLPGATCGSLAWAPGRLPVDGRANQRGRHAGGRRKSPPPDSCVPWVNGVGAGNDVESRGPAGLTARARPEARPEMRAANLHGRWLGHLQATCWKRATMS
jgi:hypothetical protein